MRMPQGSQTISSSTTPSSSADADQDLVREVLAQGEVQDEVAFGLAGVDSHVPELQGLEEHRIGQLALLLHAEDLLQVLVLDGVAVEPEVFLRAGALLLELLGKSSSLTSSTSSGRYRSR
jgi:hypothetical protein